VTSARQLKFKRWLYGNAAFSGMHWKPTRIMLNNILIAAAIRLGFVDKALKLRGKR